ncbi:MAG: hypothetical protein M1827_005011 [Pycnora praestabilis]|nr:MAG: hypothetical protein M1827_005011 [Pycnora praestabilis]
MSAFASNIRAFVQWTEQTIFAGEDVECQITFKNVAVTPGTSRSSSHKSKLHGFVPGGERQRKITPLHASASSTRNTTPYEGRSPQLNSRGHRPSLSLNVPVSSGSRRTSGSWSAGQNGIATSGQSHKRSVSIISMGGREVNGEESHKHRINGAAPLLGGKHGRSASLQVLPQKSPPSGGGPPPYNRSTTQPSPLFHASTYPTTFESQVSSKLPTRPVRRTTGIETASDTPGLPKHETGSRETFSKDFRFPAVISSEQGPSLALHSPHDAPVAQRKAETSPRTHLPRPLEEDGGEVEHLPPVTKILSGSSMNGTPRTSGDFYSMSNNSTETLASEYVPQASNRLLPRPAHARRTSNLAPTNHQRPPETLMMGYAQIMGSFTLDGSLVNQGPFEEVKRKGVVGGQGGGGVVGVERSKRDNGLFGALGWGNLGESIGGLLGGGELSSIKEMRGIASSKAIPLLSTPQSILFVDLRLAPGESKSYKYKFTLPRGLPPSYRGKTIKISYNLVVGTQRPGTVRDKQQVRHVDVPFRVFGGVNGRGEILGHDLMSPYIILQDQARTARVENVASKSEGAASTSTGHRITQDSGLDDFLSYVDNLLERPRQNSSFGLLSPTDGVPPRRISGIEEPNSAKEAIDLAILRSNIATSSNRNINRFEIARNGRRVAMIVLARPAYRLGEVITAVIDFTNADIPCYSVHATLETSEKVDPTIALRSGASIYRASRRIHASHSETTLFARRVVFSPTIPINSTPEFITSGVSLEWKLRIEFVTPLQRTGDEEEEESGEFHLLEEVARDDRGVTLAAVEGFSCETFEIAVPVRVYGAVVEGTEILETEELAV